MKWLSDLAPYALPRELRWEPALARASPRAPTGREQAILSALAPLRVLSGPQIRRRFMPAATERTTRHQLSALLAQGWVRRAHLLCAGAGQTPRLYWLDDGGETPGPAETLGLLRTNAWLFAFEQLAEVTAVRRGPSGLVLDIGGSELLLDLERTPRRQAVRAKFRRHEAVRCGAIFVFPDEPSAIAAARIANGIVGTDARQRMFFASEPDVHRGRLRALTLAPSPGPFRPSLRDILTALPEVPQERSCSGKPSLGSRTDSDAAGQREATQ